MSDAARTVLAVAAAVAAISVATVALAVRTAAHDAAPAAPAAGVEAGGPGPVAASYHDRVRALSARVAADPGDTAAALALARALHDAHRPARAIEHYERVLAVDPGRRDVWLDLADAHASAGDVPGARAAVQRFLAAFPDDPAGLYDLGVIEAQAQDTAAARTWWRRAAASGDAEIAAAARHALARTGGG